MITKNTVVQACFSPFQQRASLCLSLLSLMVMLNLTNAGQAQSIAKLQEKYQSAIKLYEQGSYEQARMLFSQLVEEDKKLILTPYSLFMIAKSSDQLGKSNEAKEQLLKLLERFPTWNKLDEVYYQLGVMDFGDGDLVAGLEDLGQITNSSFDQPGELLKRKYFTPLTIEKLKLFLEMYPEDQVVGTVLLQKLSKKDVEDLDPIFYDDLVARFDTENKYSRSQLIRSTFKRKYDVGVFLPFQLPDSVSGFRGVSHQFVFDLYDGMKQAVDWLAKDSIFLDLYPYDTERKGQTVQRLLKDPKIKNFDLLISPLYRKPLELVNAFSRQNRIPLVNPVSTNPEIIEQNEYAFLTSSSVSTQAKAAADYTHNTLDSTFAYIVYGQNQKEKIMAQDYLVKFQRNGGTVKYFEPFEAGSEGFEMLIEDFDTLRTDSTAHVFVSAIDEVTAINIKSALQNVQAYHPIFAPEEWLTFERITFEELQKFNVHMTAPNYINYENPKVKAFVDDFIAETGRVPSLFTFKGFEAIYFFGKMLHRHGTEFQHYIHEVEPEKGIIFTGLNYSGGNDNQFVPIIRFEEGELVILNSPWLVAEEPAEEIPEKE